VKVEFLGAAILNGGVIAAAYLGAHAYPAWWVLFLGGVQTVGWVFFRQGHLRFMERHGLPFPSLGGVYLSNSILPAAVYFLARWLLAD